jgi:hypothetical protein
MIEVARTVIEVVVIEIVPSAVEMVAINDGSVVGDVGVVVVDD